MLNAFLEALPLAFGTLLATLPIVGASLLLATRTRRHAHLSFLGGWVLGALVVGGLAILLSDVSAPGQGPPRQWVVVLRLFLGGCLVAFALHKWSKSRRSGLPKEAPGWMRTVETAGAGKTFAFGLVSVALNPKNATLFASGGLLIAAKTYVPVSQIAVLIAFVFVASLGVAAPLVLSLVLGQRFEALRNSLKMTTAKYNAAILSVALTVLGLVVIYNAFMDLAYV